MGRVEPSPRPRPGEGWRRRSVASEPRLSEAVELYESLGLEVLLVPVLQECEEEGAEGSCTSCFGADSAPGRFQVIYTRPKAAGDGSGESPVPGEAL